MAPAEIKGVGIANGYLASLSVGGRREGGLAWFTAFSHPHMNPLPLCANQEPSGRLGTYLYYDLLLFGDWQREGINEQKEMLGHVLWFFLQIRSEQKYQHLEIQFPLHTGVPSQRTPCGRLECVLCIVCRISYLITEVRWGHWE